MSSFISIRFNIVQVRLTTAGDLECIYVVTVPVAQGPEYVVRLLLCVSSWYVYTDIHCQACGKCEKS